MLLLVVSRASVEHDEHWVLHLDTAITLALFVPSYNYLICVKFVHKKLQTLCLDERVFNHEQVLDLVDYCRVLFKLGRLISNVLEEVVRVYLLIPVELFLDLRRLFSKEHAFENIVLIIHFLIVVWELS